MLIYTVPYMINGIVLDTSIFLSFSFAPFIGWLADVRFGRYEVIKFSSIVTFLASILYYFAMFAGESATTLSTVLYSIAIVIVSFQFISYVAAMLPFLRWRVTKINDIHDFTLHCYFREKTVPSGCFCR